MSGDPRTMVHVCISYGSSADCEKTALLNSAVGWKVHIIFSFFVYLKKNVNKSLFKQKLSLLCRMTIWSPGSVLGKPCGDHQRCLWHHQSFLFLKWQKQWYSTLFSAQLSHLVLYTGLWCSHSIIIRRLFNCTLHLSLKITANIWWSGKEQHIVERTCNVF